MARFTTKTGVTVALAVTALLGLAACSDPGATAATGSGSASASATAKQFNLSPVQDRIKVDVDSAAAAQVPDAIKADGKLTVVTTGGTPPPESFRVRQQDPHRQRGGYRVRRGRDLGP